MSDNAAGKFPDITEHDLIESYLSAVAECVDFADKKINPVLTNQINPTEGEAALLGTFYRLHLVMRGILALNDRQHFQLVVGAVRTAFELLIDLRLLANDSSGKYAAMFAAFAQVERYRVAKKVADYGTQTGAPSAIKIFEIDFAKSMASDPARKAEVEKKVRSIWGVDKKGKLKYPANHWSDKDLRARCKEAGVYYETFYLQLYSFASWHSHSGSAGYAGLDQEGLGRIYGMAVDVCRTIFLDAISVIATQFHITKVVSEFRPAMDFLKNAPKELLKDKFLRLHREREKAKAE